MAKLCKKPGKIAIFVGNHRYLCQDMNEIRFRSYFRERATNFQVLDAITTFEDSKYGLPKHSRPPAPYSRSLDCSSQAVENPGSCGDFART